MIDLGKETSCIHRKSLGANSTSSVITFHRPRGTWDWRRWIQNYPFSSDALRLAEFDDLVFDPDLAEWSPAVRNRHLSLWRTRRLFRANKLALSYFNRISVSTQPLADHASRLFPEADIRVFPNCIPCSWRGMPIPKESEPRRRLTYFPGTRGHNADFAMVSSAVERFLQSHPDWEILVVGPLDFKLNVSEHQIVRMKRVSFDLYPDLVRTGAINLAPLENTIFNQCKSAIKVMEAGFFGIPSVASPIPDAMRFAGDGVEFASDADEWLAAMEKLASRFPYPYSWREELRHRIELNASAEDVAIRWLEWLGLECAGRSHS